MIIIYFNDEIAVIVVVVGSPRGGDGRGGEIATMITIDGDGGIKIELVVVVEIVG